MCSRGCSGREKISDIGEHTPCASIRIIVSSPMIFIYMNYLKCHFIYSMCIILKRQSGSCLAISYVHKIWGRGCSNKFLLVILLALSVCRLQCLYLLSRFFIHFSRESSTVYESLDRYGVIPSLRDMEELGYISELVYVHKLLDEDKSLSEISFFNSQDSYSLQFQPSASSFTGFLMKFLHCPPLKFC